MNPENNVTSVAQSLLETLQTTRQENLELGHYLLASISCEISYAELRSNGVDAWLRRNAVLDVCFWWMHRISSRQDAMLEELHEMTARIEKLSQAEHDLVSDVHSQVSEIKEHVENVREVVSSERS